MEEQLQAERFARPSVNPADALANSYYLDALGELRNLASGELDEEGGAAAAVVQVRAYGEAMVRAYAHFRMEAPAYVLDRANRFVAEARRRMLGGAPELLEEEEEQIEREKGRKIGRPKGSGRKWAAR
jgi:hypothetical protein